MGTRTRPTTPTARPPLSIGHPFTTPPVQPIIPADLHRGRSPRISADPGRKKIAFAPGYSLARCTIWVQRFSPTTLPAEPHFWYKARDGLWWLGKVAHDASTDNSSARSYIVRFLNDPGSIKIGLHPSSYTTSRSAVHGSWCRHGHQVGGLDRSVLRHADVPRGAPPIPPLVCREIAINHSFGGLCFVFVLSFL